MQKAASIDKKTKKNKSVNKKAISKASYNYGKNGPVKEKKFKKINPISLIILVGFIILFLYKCPFRFLFGVSCPGCGMTRAFFSLCVLDFHLAFLYHPLWPLVVIALLIIVLYKTHVMKLNKKQINILLWAFVIIFIAVYVIRLCSGSPIVKPSLHSSFFYKLFHRG